METRRGAWQIRQNIPARSDDGQYFASERVVWKEGKSLNFSTRDAYTVMLKDYPDVMDINQMSEALGVSKKTGYKLLQNGAITYMKIGRCYRIPKAHLMTYLQIGRENSHAF